MITTLDLKKIGIKTAYSYIEKNPEKNMLKLMDWVDHFAGSGPDSFEEQRAIIRQIAADPDSQLASVGYAHSSRHRLRGCKNSVH